MIAELMVVGFISLLLTFGEAYITKVYIPQHVADTMLPCPADGVHDQTQEEHAAGCCGLNKDFYQMLNHAKR